MCSHSYRTEGQTDAPAKRAGAAAPEAASTRKTAREKRREALLDAALQETFPASDPVAISFEPPARDE